MPKNEQFNPKMKRKIQPAWAWKIQMKREIQAKKYCKLKNIDGLQR